MEKLERLFNPQKWFFERFNENIGLFNENIGLFTEISGLFTEVSGLFTEVIGRFTEAIGRFNKVVLSVVLGFRFNNTIIFNQH